MNKNEYILCAAVWIPDGVKRSDQPVNIKHGFVVAGRRHSDCYNTVKVLLDPHTGNEEITRIWNTGVAGFITSSNRFLNREDSFQLAALSGQLSTELIESVTRLETVKDFVLSIETNDDDDTDYGPSLVSEMLYSDSMNIEDYREGLTKKQHDCFVYMVDYRIKFKKWPSTTKVAMALGIKRTSAHSRMKQVFKFIPQK